MKWITSTKSFITLILFCLSLLLFNSGNILANTFYDNPSVQQKPQENQQEEIEPSDMDNSTESLEKDSQPLGDISESIDSKPIGEDSLDPVSKSIDDLSESPDQAGKTESMEDMSEQQPLGDREAEGKGL